MIDNDKNRGGPFVLVERGVEGKRDRQRPVLPTVF
jgi:hypothetical protein